MNVLSNEFSIAGFYPVEDAGRDVYDFRLGWRFHKGAADGAKEMGAVEGAKEMGAVEGAKEMGAVEGAKEMGAVEGAKEMGAVEGAEAADFDDASWESVSIPHGLELLPAEASGSINYQGEAWYRKRFRVPAELAGKRLFVHFEAIMGKSKVWVNGQLVAEHFGGFLPIHLDLTDALDANDENVIAVWADNSDDETYPPGKPQERLDWTYFGGIYRDAWLIATNDLHISDPNAASKVAGGGVFVRTAELNDSSATISISVDLANHGAARDCVIENSIVSSDGVTVGSATSDCRATSDGAAVEQTIVVERPDLWTPATPTLYELQTLVKLDGVIVDGVITRFGIRTIDFRGRDGFFLNGLPYEGKLIGGNRHQDFAYVGNALPNSMHVRDAKRLRDAGMTIIRTAHYPLDPAFMDACDELGLFVIVTTPGWQFFNEDQLFQDRVCDDIRNMVRRDRNRPCVLMWECVLNEVKVSDDFAWRIHNVTHEEYPYPGCYTAGDFHRSEINREIYDVMYDHYDSDYSVDKSYFQREWGDCVDDFHAHNSPSRASRDWGEAAQLVQALQYADPGFEHPCLEKLHAAPRQHVGGCLWHSFDHQRGYHPDPFWGGLMDAFRQPKYSYEMFRSQQDAGDVGPIVFVANEMTPFSGSDVWVFTNCEEVRLSVFGKVVATKKCRSDDDAMPHPPVCFENVYTFREIKQRGRDRWREQEIIAEGLIGREVVASFKRTPSRRKDRIELRLDDCDIPLTADGADFTMVIAEVVDEEGVVKRLNKDWIRFEVEGEGAIIGDHRIAANPRAVEWGSAPVLIRSTTTAGSITVRARLEYPGITTPQAGAITFDSVPATTPFA